MNDSKFHDGCEWNPETMSGAYASDTHYRETHATMLVGANGQWRLCRSCAELPYFARYSKKPIRRTPKPSDIEAAEQRGYERGRAEERAETIANLEAWRDNINAAPNTCDAEQMGAVTLDCVVRMLARKTIEERGEHAGEVEASDAE